MIYMCVCVYSHEGPINLDLISKNVNCVKLNLSSTTFNSKTVEYEEMMLLNALLG